MFMLSTQQQYDLITAIIADTNYKYRASIVYAGHELYQEGLQLKLFLLKAAMTPTPYFFIQIPWKELHHEAQMLGFEAIAHRIRRFS